MAKTGRRAQRTREQLQKALIKLISVLLSGCADRSDAGSSILIRWAAEQ